MLGSTGIIVLALIGALIGVYAAREKGEDPLLYGLAGAVLLPLAVLAVIVLFNIILIVVIILLILGLAKIILEK